MANIKSTDYGYKEDERANCMKDINEKAELAWIILSHLPVKYAKHGLTAEQYYLEPDGHFDGVVPYCDSDKGFG